MYSEAQLNEMLAVFLARCQAVNEEYIIAMADQIMEIGQLIPSSVNRLVQYQRMNANLDGIKREIARLADISIPDLEKIFETAARLDMRFAAETFGNEFRPSIMQMPGLKQAMAAQLAVTGGEMANLSRTTVEDAAYKKAVDAAISAAQMGVEDYNSAIRRALGEAAGTGMQVTYPSGRKLRLDSAVRMNVLDGIRALNNEVLRQAGEMFGADGVEISAHRLCAEDHLPYQGQQYSHKAFADLQARLKRPFGMWNCRHSMHPILLGISRPAYTEGELEGFRTFSETKVTIDGVSRTRYEWSQEQRKIEVAIRRQKDEALAYKRSGDMPARRRKQALINALTERYTKVSEAAGLQPDHARAAVRGFSDVKTEKELKRKPEDNKKAS